MLSIALRVVAFIAFIAAGANQVLLGQGSLDEIAWGLSAWVLATLVGAVTLSR